MDRDISVGKRGIFGPLKFPESSKSSSESFNFDGSGSACCMLCNSTFMLPAEKNEFLLHLCKIHKLVIADVDKIACLKSYADYWRSRFLVQPLAYYCTTMLCSISKESDGKEEYFLLSDVLPEDKLLREGLQKKRLEWILDIQKTERETSVSRSCMLCKLQFEGPRSDYFQHLHTKHHLHLGCPENLVFTDELLDVVENYLKRLQCIFCEGYFKERNILKEHMRKKQHKRVNPKNKSFDRYYIVNYLEMGKTWQEVLEEKDEIDVGEEMSDWSDWEEDNVEPQIVCLFCNEGKKSFEAILNHMIEEHDFHFQETCHSHQLNFYQKIKLVNYIRFQMYNVRCSNCEDSFSTREELLEHMTEKRHFEIPNSKLWDQPEYYFPTYENDSLLCYLEDDISDDVDNNHFDSHQQCEREV